MPTSDEIIQNWFKTATPPAAAPSPSPSAPTDAIPNVPGRMVTAPPPGTAEGLTGPVATNKDLYDKLVSAHRTNGLVEANLRNLSYIYHHLQPGIGVPYESTAAKLLIQFGLDPKKVGLPDAASVEQAKKAASAALYATMQQAPSLVADIAERQNLKPGVVLEPDAAYSLVNNGLLNVAVSEAQLADIGKFMSGHGGSYQGYRPDQFAPDVAGLQERIYQSLPNPKGGGQVTEPSARPVQGTQPIVTPTNPLPPTGTPAPTKELPAASQAPVATAPILPAGIPTGAVEVGTLKGNKVYADPKDPTKRWVVEP